ncbi:tetratricopeptide repeat protein [bacterium]|nr:MAG: tetratricopeptide repeat protein [bacterium]
MGVKENILEKARKFIERGLFDKAIGEYRSAIDFDPKDIAIRLKIGDLYVKMGSSEEAIKEYLEVARTNAQRGFYLKAIAVYKQVLKLDVANLDVHNKLAELYTRQRLIVDAISEYSYLVASFEKNRKTKEVLDILKKMIEIDPENVGIRLKLADHYQKSGFTKDALSEYSGIFSKLIAQGKADKAEKIYHTLQTHAFGKEPQVLNGLMEICLTKGSIDEYLKYARLLAKSYKDSGDTEQAVRVAEDILKQKPDDHEALGLLSHFQAPQLTEKKAEHDITGHEVLKALDMEAHEAPLIDMPELHTSRSAIEGIGGKEAGSVDSAVRAEEEEPLISITPPEQTPDKIDEPKPYVAQPEDEGIEIDIEGFGEHEVQAPVEAEEIIETPELHVDEVPATCEDEPLVDIDFGFEPASTAVTAASVSPKDGEFTLEVDEHGHEAAPPPSAEFPSRVKDGEPVTAPVSAQAAVEVLAPHEEVGPQMIEEDVVTSPAQAPQGEAEEEGGAGEEFVDLAAEVGLADMGLESMIDKVTGSFAAGSDEETANEFKTGMEKQLDKEDSETHYNLGIAYMEMELYGEACKEFKVALKDPRLEFDCLARLGLCAVAGSNHEDAINYYLKALKISGKSDDERKGLMYELALANEAASNRQEAERLFRSIYSVDTEFRDIAAKIKEYDYGKAPAVVTETEPEVELEAYVQEESAAGDTAPASDSMLEVELL